MKVSILVSDLSRNCVARAYHRVRVLERHYEVEVIGPVFGKGIFNPFEDEIPYHSVHPGKLRFPEFVGTLLELLKCVRGKIVYALQPRLTSFGVALLAKLSRRLPVILEIFDWDAEPFLHQSLLKKLSVAIRYLPSPFSGAYDWFFERLIPFADERIVGSEFLLRRYGGAKLYHGADCHLFDPTRVNRKGLREKFALTGKAVILFAGTALPHKGLEDLIAAIKILKRDSVRVMLVGEGGYNDFLQRSAGDCVINVGLRPYHLLPELLTLADLVVLPQRNTPYAQAQVPGKLFDAMAMAKPIIATAVSDLPEILSGCGWVVEPGNPTALAEAIEFVLHNPDLTGETGWKARKKCEEKYSWDAMEKVLTPLFQRHVG